MPRSVVRKNIYIFSFLLVLIACMWMTFVSTAQSPFPSEAVFRTLPHAEAKNVLQKLLKVHGVDATWDFLLRAYKDGEVTRFGEADAHLLAHMMGGEFYMKYGLEALTICGEGLNGGCLHGVIERMIEEKGPDSIKELDEDCRKLNKAHDCAHGAGHGLNEANARNIKTTIRACHLFGPPLLDSCVTGALMDASWRNTMLQHEPWAFCDTLERRYAESCATSVGNYFAYNRKNIPIPSVEKVCEEAPTESMKTACMVPVSQAIVRREKGVVSRIRNVCMSLAHSNREHCLHIAAEFLIGSSFTDATPSELCDSLFVGTMYTCQQH